MTRRKRRNHSPAFKAKVALAALKGEKTIGDLSAQFDVHANQITGYRRSCAATALADAVRIQQQQRSIPPKRAIIFPPQTSGGWRARPNE